MRICSSCKIEKNVDQFWERKGSKDGLNRRCKTCITEAKRKWEIENKEKVVASREKRKESIREGRRKWHAANPEYSKNYKRKYSRSKRLMERMENDEVLKCKIKISKSIGGCIKEYVNNNTSYKKDSNTINILGCNYEEFKSYIESKFKPWMNWDNYGKYNGEFNYGWDFDHIIPASSAKTVEEVYRLNHYTNFQPLCSKVNRDIKRDKIDFQKVDYMMQNG
jgi:hypothetical protein